MPVKNNYARRKGKSSIEEEDRESIKEINNIKKYSGVTFYAGVLGLIVAGVNYFISGEPNPQTLQEPLNQLNNMQLVDTAIFGISSLGYLGGGLIYGLSVFMEDDEIKHVKKKIRSRLEKEVKD
jgi:hypothetical protein